MGTYGESKRSIIDPKRIGFGPLLWHGKCIIKHRIFGFKSPQNNNQINNRL